MGALSRTEINLQRLLRHCETMATEAQHNEQKVDWRLSKVSLNSHKTSAGKNTKRNSGGESFCWIGIQYVILYSQKNHSFLLLFLQFCLLELPFERRPLDVLFVFFFIRNLRLKKALIIRNWPGWSKSSNLRNILRNYFVKKTA